MADVLEGRRGSPWITVGGPGEPFVTVVQRNSDFAVNSWYRPARSYPMAPDRRTDPGPQGGALAGNLADHADQGRHCVRRYRALSMRLSRNCMSSHLLDRLTCRSLGTC